MSYDQSGPSAVAAPSDEAETILRRYARAKDRRNLWEGHWRECYELALPQRENVITGARPGEKKGTRLYDATATDAVDQLAASLLSELTPPWSRWFGFTPGKDAPEDQASDMADVLERAADVLQGHFDRSNFAVEMHQCYLDLVTAGTACLMFEEAPVGEPSAFRFTAVPLSSVVFEEGLSGALNVTYRRAEWTSAQFRDRFPDVVLDQAPTAESDTDEDLIAVIEAVTPGRRGYDYVAVREPDASGNGIAEVIRRGTFRASPFINFRWQKAPGEVYGRSPVMKALPDIKTANKVVELVLKNASIAVTGIWQADDDGVLNPATIRLEPGTIIPKAVGSAGLTPLRPANDMDLSTIVLDQMRDRIRHALLVDLLGQPDKQNMTATEVVQRSLEMARLLGATYGRLQSELLTPLAMRAVGILQRRGEVPRFEVDGRIVALDYTSPLARHRAQREAQMIGNWLAQVNGLGPQATGLIDPVKAARHLARAYAIPQDILRDPDDVPNAAMPSGDLSELLGGDVLDGVMNALSSDVVSPQSGAPTPVAEGAADVPT